VKKGRKGEVARETARIKIVLKALAGAELGGDRRGGGTGSPKVSTKDILWDSIQDAERKKEAGAKKGKRANACGVKNKKGGERECAGKCR